MATCPYCKAPMADPPPEASLTGKQHQIYQTVLAAGTKGVCAGDLLRKHYKDRSPTTLRTCIYQINQKVRPINILSRNGVYFIAQG